MRSQRRFSRIDLLASFVALSILTCAWIAHAQQPPAAEADTFTGKAFRLESKGYGLSRRGFEAAARSDWHTHDGAQLLFVEEGRMRAQVEGQPMKEVGKGESILLPGGVAHWHGAVPAQAATQLSVTFAGGIKWMEKVNDTQYAGKAKR